MKQLFKVLGFTVLAACAGEPAEYTKEVATAKVAPSSKQGEVKAPTKQVRVLSLNSNQVIRLTGEVSRNVDSLILQLGRLNKDSSVKVIYLLIDSPGGSVLDGARFVSAIEASRKPVNTVCMTMCASMAAIIHQYGSKRMMLDRSVLMFHDAAGGLQGSLPQMRSRLNFYDRLTTKMDAYIAQRAGLDLAQFMVDLHSEVWIDAEDSTERHLNDQIVFVTVEGEGSENALESPMDHTRFVTLE